jgi:cyclopropane-fatty-acyl-phospholipid synthase
VNLLQKLGLRALFGRLEKLREGRLTVEYPDGKRVFGSGSEPDVSIRVHDNRFFSTVALGGHLGAAEAYVDGWWSADDLTSLVRLLLRNRDVLDGLESGWARLAAPLRFLLHALNRNSRNGARRNIRAHYDLGNEFFALFLDETMTYSCGIFEGSDSSLADASAAKYDRLCRKLDLNPEDHVVEIGTGWGGFAVHAARNYGCRVTTTTISAEQHKFATERIAAAGLEEQVTVLLNDYRDLEGTFDKLVSIEMIEAVGHQYFETFFETCSRLLVPNGQAAIQAITIQDRYYEQARREVDFIKRYIFPGSCLPAVAVLTGAASNTDLRLVHLEDITPHYATTLARWRADFMRNWDQIREQGFSDQFRRLWEFYFCYCEGGFREAVLGDLQLVFAKPRASGQLRLDVPKREAVAAW